MTDENPRQLLADLETRVGRVAEIATADALEAERVAVLGRKSGRLTALLRGLGRLDADERRDLGAAANILRARYEDALEARAAALAADGPTRPSADLTMPARRRWVGALHPVTRVVDELVEIFRELGFVRATGPEIETEWTNFRALNFPPDHPAMDMHDTLYLGAEEEGEPLLLRTHTSPVQVRVLQQAPPPVRILSPGTVYRKDPFDPSHAPMFTQVEGLAVDEGITFVDLKATLAHFAGAFFGSGTRVRFRPSYFPFTEPSAEMDVRCRLCGGGGCGACKQTGWMEILGCGMVHPTVLANCGVDAERYTGFAFGMGPERIAMARYGIPDIRLLYAGDMDLLAQLAANG